jgi:hypothetical protein
VQTIQNTENTSTLITKTPTQLSKHPHITKTSTITCIRVYIYVTDAFCVLRNGHNCILKLPKEITSRYVFKAVIILNVHSVSVRTHMTKLTVAFCSCKRTYERIERLEKTTLSLRDVWKIINFVTVTTI